MLKHGHSFGTVQTLAVSAGAASAAASTGAGDPSLQAASISRTARRANMIRRCHVLRDGLHSAKTMGVEGSCPASSGGNSRASARGATTSGVVDRSSTLHHREAINTSRSSGVQPTVSMSVTSVRARKKCSIERYHWRRPIPCVRDARRTVRSARRDQFPLEARGVPPVPTFRQLREHHRARPTGVRRARRRAFDSREAGRDGAHR